MNVNDVKSAHLIGAGGINMSAVGKLLLAAGVKVSGSDVVESEQTKLLTERGAVISIGESADHIPADCDVVIYTSAAPVTNKERMAAAERKIPEMTNFAFLGDWFSDAKTYVVTGTHGKSTTTAMLGLALERGKMDPTVVVGSKVPGFADGNLRLGKPDLFVVEGDEYARHFLEFHPDGVILNNLELDHTDVFRNIDALIESFHELVSQVKEDGVIVYNVSDERLKRLIETEIETVTARRIRVIAFGDQNVGEDVWRVSSKQDGDYRVVSIEKPGVTYRFNLSIPGHFNAMNAAGACLLARELGVAYADLGPAFESFKGIWRRFEFLGEKNEMLIYSDYGHHPTAVAATLKAANESFPERRVLLCFQPHHRNRTKSLFLEFIPSFDGADELVLCEIYDVAGRDATDDADVSSHDLVDAIIRHDADRGITRTVEYAANPEEAVKRVLEMAKPDDIVICMGAGDIDNAIRKAIV
ncbi:MAG: UDP-N-acetylmuramate--L-alanine ligase [Patescibacteria group bacterium]|jgi:UDP-N-acetylmuramate--alanine ligase